MPFSVPRKTLDQGTLTVHSYSRDIILTLSTTLYVLSLAVLSCVWVETQVTSFPCDLWRPSIVISIQAFRRLLLVYWDPLSLKSWVWVAGMLGKSSCLLAYPLPLLWWTPHLLWNTDPEHFLYCRNQFSPQLDFCPNSRCILVGHCSSWASKCLSFNISSSMLIATHFVIPLTFIGGTISRHCVDDVYLQDSLLSRDNRVLQCSQRLLRGSNSSHVLHR